MGYTHGKRWDEEEIKRSVLEIVEKMGMDRMPSRSEIEEYTGNTALTNKLAKSGGIYHYAELLGLPIKKSETLFAMKYEGMVKSILLSQGMEADLTPMKAPYDILVNKRVKIDVKASRVVKSGPSDCYSFNLEKPMQTCDVYVAITLEESDEIKDIYIIPASVMSGKNQLSIGIHNSKYADYIERWDIIKTLDACFQVVETFRPCRVVRSF